jgi:hypothetical protein
MTPAQALTTLEAMLAQLTRLAPAFHTREDWADLAEARLALREVAQRLAVQLARDTAAHKETHL